MSGLPALGWVDWAMLAALALSVLAGLARGLVFELMSLAGWVVAYVAAQIYSPLVGTWVPIGVPGSALHQGAAFAATFLGVLLAWAVLARLVRLLIRATPLTVIDRLLGAVFGGLRGLLLLLVVATIVSYTPALRAQAWQDAKGAAWLGQIITLLKPWLPDEVARHLPA